MELVNVIGYHLLYICVLIKDRFVTTIQMPPCKLTRRWGLKDFCLKVMYETKIFNVNRKSEVSISTSDQILRKPRSESKMTILSKCLLTRHGLSVG